MRKGANVFVRNKRQLKVAIEKNNLPLFQQLSLHYSYIRFHPSVIAKMPKEFQEYILAFNADPEGTKKKVRQEEKEHIEWLTLVLFVSDDYLSIKRRRKMKVARFIQILLKLPYELQSKIVSQTVANKGIISCEDFNSCLKKMVKKYL